MFGRRALVAAFILFAAGGAYAKPRAPVCRPMVVAPVTADDISCALRRWYVAVNAKPGFPTEVASLYAERGSLLLSTLKAEPYQGRANITPYFAALLRHHDLSVTSDQPTTMPDKFDLFPNGGAVSGFYTFRWHDPNEPETVAPARFTFVYLLDTRIRQLEIVTHHSSKTP
jgi:hypothetical protein